jgi:hypothetical protein
MAGPYWGDFPINATISIPFDTFAGSTGASITMSGFAASDVEIYKNGGTTQRASDNGYTTTTDFDSLTGLHMLVIDTSDNSDPGFFAAGNEYQVAVSSVTIDGQTVSFWAGTFSIERSGGALAMLKDATYGLSALETLVDDLESRLTATRAGYLDNLSAGAVALQSSVDDLEGRLTAARAGYLDNLNIGGNVASQASVDTIDDFLDTEIASIKAKTDNLPADPADASDIASSFTTVNGKLDAIDDLVDTEIATIISRLGIPSDLGSGATVAANLADIESQTDEIGVAGAGLTALPWNASWDAEVESEVQDAIEVNNLDHLVKSAVDTDFATTVHLNSVIGHLADNGTSATFDRTTDSQEAIRDRGDAAWITATGFSTLDAAGVRSAVGLASANLDTQLSTIDDLIDTEIATLIANVATILAAVDTEVSAIKAKTDNLPASPAATGDIPTTSDIKAQVVAALITDTYAEPSAVPAATASLKDKIGWIAALARNKITQTNALQTLRNDADSGNIGTATTSNDGTVTTRAEWQ